MEEGSLNLNKDAQDMYLQVIELPGGYKVLVLSTTPIQELPVNWLMCGE